MAKLQTYTIYEVNGGRKIHLFNSLNFDLPPNRAQCGASISWDDDIEPLNDRVFLEENDCKRCCNSLEKGYLGWKIRSD